MDSAKIRELENIASDIKKDIVRMIGIARSGSLEIPLSVAQLFVFLYWEVFGVKSPNNPKFFLGISECTPALYAVLSKKGYFEREELWHFRRLGSILPALPDFRRTPGIDAPCIISGIELAIATANSKIDIGNGNNERISICLSPNGILDKDDFFSEAQCAANYGLGNLIQIFLTFTTDNAMPDKVQNNFNKLTDIGWQVEYVQGTDFKELAKVFDGYNYLDKKPKSIFLVIEHDSNLINAKAKTAGFLSSINSEEMDTALEELEGRINE
jgi:transketolase